MKKQKIIITIETEESEDNKVNSQDNMKPKTDNRNISKELNYIIDKYRNM